MGLFGARSGHPLANAKELQQVLEELAGMEDAAVVAEVRVWLESLAETDDLRNATCLQLVLQLDEAAGLAAQRLGRHYLTQPPTTRSADYRLWTANHGYWLQLVAAYEFCLERQQGGRRADQLTPAELAQLHVHLMAAYAAAIKWTLLHYLPVPAALWLGCGRLYQLAEAAGWVEQPLALHGGGRTLSIAQRYLQTLMVQASAVNALPPLQIELADRLVAYLAPEVVFSRQNDAANVYWVDLAQGLPPTRLAQLPALTPTLRFLRPGAALTTIAALHERMRREGGVPPDLQLGGQYPVADVLAVLHHLALNWQAKPPMRHHQRRVARTRLQVLHGFETIHQQLSRGQVSLPRDAEEWLADDASLGGLGARAPLDCNDWLRIGSLVAVRPDGGENWLIAVVRRLGRGDSHASVGLQTLGKSPLALVADSQGLETAVIVLDSEPLLATGRAAEGAARLAGRDVMLVMASNTVEIGVGLLVSVNQQVLRLQQEAQVAANGDYSQVRCRLATAFMAS